MSHTKDNVGAIVGGILGGLTFLLMATAVFVFWRKHKRQHNTYPLTMIDYDSTKSPMVPASEEGPLQRAPDRPSFSQSLPLPGGGEPSNPFPAVLAAAPAVSRKRRTFPAVLAAAPVMSRKRREALGLSHQCNSAQGELPLLAASSSDSGSISGPEDLRVKLEQLRREVESIRRTGDAPPEYT